MCLRGELRLLDLHRNRFSGDLCDIFDGAVALDAEEAAAAAAAEPAAAPRRRSKRAKKWKLRYLDLSRLTNGAFAATSSLVPCVRRPLTSRPAVTGSLTTLPFAPLRALRVFKCNGINLYGNIPAELVETWVHLEDLGLARCGLRGSIPAALVEGGKALSRLDVHGNKLTGMLPAFGARHRRLRYLDASANELCGRIPASLDECPVLEELFLYGNCFDVDFTAAKASPTKKKRYGKRGRRRVVTL